MGAKQELYRRLAELPAVLSGRLPDPSGEAQRLWRLAGVEALAVAREAFIEKARGGTDAAGITWAPLKPATVAYGRRHPGLAARRARARRAGRESRPLLSAAQDRLWRGVYARELARARRDGVPAREAQGRAAALAWAVVKRAGGQTVLGKYGAAGVEIGRDTGRLLASLSPGHPDNTLAVRGPGRVVVGSNVAYARHFHAKRPLWPSGGSLPAQWEARLAGVVGEGVRALVRRLVEGIARAS